MSFFEPRFPHDNFHWLAGMLSGAGLLAMAAMFLSGDGLAGKSLFVSDSQTAIVGIGDICVWPADCSGNDLSPQGSFDGADCGTAWGWAYDPEVLSQPIIVELREGAVVWGSAWANQTRPELAGFQSNGHAFSMAMPDALKNGQPHNLSIYAYNHPGTGGGNRVVATRTMQCGSAPTNTPPRGALDAVSSGVSAVAGGWAQDQDVPNQPIEVHFYLDGLSTWIGAASAGEYRGDLCGALGSCNHGFNWTVPAQYCNGQPHTLYAYGIDASGGANPVLPGSPKSFQCSGPPVTYGQPTATITADSQNITTGQSTTIRATFAAGQNDTLVGTNIDSPEGAGLGNATQAGPKTITFTPSTPGTYTFYARVLTEHYGWQTKATVSVVVATPPPATVPPAPQGLSHSCNQAATSVALSWDPVAGADHYWLGLDDTVGNGPSCQDGWICPGTPDYSANQYDTSETINTIPGHPLRMMVASCNAQNGCSAANEAAFTCNVQQPVLPQPALTITANGQTGIAAIPVNTSVTLAWDSDNVEAGSCSVTNNAGQPPLPGDTGSQNIGSLTADRIYTLNCDKTDGTPASPATVTIDVQSGAIDGPLTAEPARVVRGRETHLSWHTVGMLSCRLSYNGDAGVPVTISNDLADSDEAFTMQRDTNFTLDCTDGTLNFSQSINVQIQPNIGEI